MTVDRDTAELAAFEEHLDVHGSRAERWPEAARVRFEPLLQRNERARELLGEARALETLLDRAPLPGARRADALASRIISVATAEAPNSIAAPMIDLAAHRQTQARAPTFRWKMASALAASLLVGIYLGASPPVTSTVEAIASAIGVAAEAEGSDLVLIYDLAADEEDFL